MKPSEHFKKISLFIIWIWFTLFALLPFCLVLVSSILSHSSAALITPPITFEHYARLANPLYWQILQKSILVAGITTFISLCLGYPFAYIIATATNRFKPLLLLLVIIPFWTSSLIRSYAMIAMLKAKGILNSLLLMLGIIHEPLTILFTNTAVIMGLVYNLLPFMILPLITNIERLDRRLIDAAHDLGANWLTTFRRVIIPLTLPGILAGSIMVFLPAMTIFYIPDILGGAKSMLLGNLIQNQFFIAENWPMGAAISTMLTILLALLILFYLWATKGSKRSDWL